MKKSPVLLLLAFGSFSAMAQSTHFSTTDSMSADNLNWHNLSPEVDEIPGVACYQAYKELIKEEAKRKIIVAVIDSGVDIEHEDLQGKIWVNTDEIPDNGIDDDQNGYVDDIHGWNYLGNAEGKHVGYESLEMTRIIRDYNDQFKDVEDPSTLAPEERRMYRMYKRAVKDHKSMTKNFKTQKNQMSQLLYQYELSIKLLGIGMDKKDFTDEDLAAFRPEDQRLKECKNLVESIHAVSGGIEQIREAEKELTIYVDYHLNTEFNGRELIGDNLDDITDIGYGNNDVRGVEADHGTFVASLIAANRNNGIGIDGIASSVEIMALRAVPKGDEYDKDIALAVRYAVDNGANIINMSFGKDFSPNKKWVDDAMKYAAEHNVLLVHGSGNDAKDNDVGNNFPNDRCGKECLIETWLEVGANSKENGKALCGSFSNYGQNTVDIFAPGVQVIGCIPDNKYAMLDGTSFASPIAAGVAALVWSHYPDMTAVQLKELLMETSTNYKKVKVQRPTNLDKKKKVKFKTLSVSGGVINAFKALEEAGTKS